MVANLCCDCAVWAVDRWSNNSSHRDLVANDEWRSTSMVVAVRLADIGSSATISCQCRHEKCAGEWGDNSWGSFCGTTAVSAGRAAELPAVWCATLCSAG